MSRISGMASSISSLMTGTRVGVDAMRVNPLRTVLSTLGVVIGVGALVAVLSLGDGMERAARTQIERTTDIQTVGINVKTSEQVDGQNFPVRDYPVFTRADAELAGQIPGVIAMSLTSQGRVVVDLPETGKRRNTVVSGVLSRADEFYHMKFVEGRLFTDAETQRASHVVVLSNKLATDLMDGRDPERIVGRMVRVNGQPCEVIGVLEPYDGETSWAAYVPFDAARSLLPAVSPPRPTTILLRAESVEHVPALASLAGDWVAERFTDRRKAVEVQTSETRIAQASQGILMFKLFMGAITGISLIVGGIGIMNVLLASVSERTREIGIRKAVGARKRDILLQFLAESVAIASAGSLIGIVLGLTSALAITAIIRRQSEASFLAASFSWSTIAVAALLPVFVGLVFGTYPARRASHLSPIDAIRHE